MKYLTTKDFPADGTIHFSTRDPISIGLPQEVNQIIPYTTSESLEEVIQFSAVGSATRWIGYNGWSAKPEVDRRIKSLTFNFSWEGVSDLSTNQKF